MLYFPDSGVFSALFVKSYFEPKPMLVPEFLRKIFSPAYVLLGQLHKNETTWPSKTKNEGIWRMKRFA